MLVKELIEQLELLPQDMEVTTDSPDFVSSKFHGVREVREVEVEKYDGYYREHTNDNKPVMNYVVVIN